MRLIRKLSFLILVAATMYAPSQSVAQSDPAGFGPGGLPLVAGGSYVNFNLDWGAGRRMGGERGWVDYNLTAAKGFLRRVGVEAEGQSLNLDRPSTLHVMRQTTLQGGLNVAVFTHKRFRFFAKGLVGGGWIDYSAGPGGSKSEAIYSAGGGVDWRPNRRLTVRADYETQWWPDLFNRGTALTPNGFSAGVGYNFGLKRRH